MFKKSLGEKLNTNNLTGEINNLKFNIEKIVDKIFKILNLKNKLKLINSKKLADFLIEDKTIKKEYSKETLLRTIEETLYNGGYITEKDSSGKFKYAVGYIQNDDILYLNGLLINPKYRGVKTTKKIFNAIEKIMNKTKINFLEFDALKENKILIRMYEKKNLNSFIIDETNSTKTYMLTKEDFINYKNKLFK